MREPMAEFAGTAVFIMIGTGVDCSVVLSTDPAVASTPKGVSRFWLKVGVYYLLFFLLGLSLYKSRLGSRSCNGRMDRWWNFGRACQPCGMLDFLLSSCFI